MLVSMIISLLSSTGTRITNAYEELIVKSNLRDVVMEIDSNTSRLKEPLDYNLNINSQEVYQQWILNNLSDKYNFFWSRTDGRVFSSAILNNEKLLLKVLAKLNQEANNSVDKMIISSGSHLNPDEKLARREIIVGDSFAIKNNIKIGDIIRVQKDEYGSDLFVKSNPEIAKIIN
ncbi:hypothetical protein [Spiroplasma taiwanense]|uniref:hypothetical protein n=1 Tax=Spiroplasma taiwanense TaxID=2145 RepID=UPI0003FCE200|nr:hypothetical protein [Spiroplasma taiwanense]